jgi:hypothetical protein
MTEKPKQDDDFTAPMSEPSAELRIFMEQWRDATEEEFLTAVKNNKQIQTEIGKFVFSQLWTKLESKRRKRRKP